MAMMATKLSISMDLVTHGYCVALLAIILGEVPEEISAWKPDTAPQAMVIKQKGKTLPEKIGPVPSTKRVKAGSCNSGRTIRMPTASMTITPSLTKVLR